MFEQPITDSLKKEVKGQITLEIPPDPKMGDYAFPCFALAKEQRKNPAQLAKEIAAKIKKHKIIDKIEANGPYINFHLRTDAIATMTIPSILTEKENYGSTDEGKGKTAVIDYSSPNIGKPFHIGHLRSTIIGQSIHLLHKFYSYNTVRINHLGDWGVQYGKLIYAHLKWGDEKKLKKNPISYLLDIYVKFGEKAKKKPELQEEAKKWFQKLENNDETAQKYWATFKKYSLKEFERIYSLFRIEFDSYDGEAFYINKTQPVLKALEEKKLSKEDEGALIVPFDNMTPLMLRKSDGTTTYALRDLAAINFRNSTYSPSKILYVTGAEQQLHFRQLFETAKKLGWDKAELKHIFFGMYLDKNGKKMATREGTVLLLDEVLQSTIKKAKKLINQKNPKLKDKAEVARKVGVGAVFFGDLMNDRIKDIVYDWDKILDFEGDTGPYLQYTHARASSILRKAKLKPSTDFNPAALSQENEAKLIRLLSKFKQKTKEALDQYKPHILAQYCLELARCFNEFYHSCPCIAEKDSEKKKARLSLVEATRQVLNNGLSLLNIEAPNEM